VVTLPAGTRLLHIGPHKTGTTTVQAAFHQNREALASQGVHYAGNTPHPMVAAMAAATGKALATSQLSAGKERWRELVEEVAASEARATVVSSEFFSEAPPARIRGILDDLDPDRTHVVVTLRPIIRILASQWQQYMQNRPAIKYDDSLGYEEWLDAILNRPDERTVTPSFWKRHRHDELIRTWADIVGPDRMTVVVVDESDKKMLVRSFEEMLGLTEGTLEPRELSSNRSLTLAEVQMLRAFNRRYLDQGWSTADYTRFVRFGAVRVLQERSPRPDEPRLLTPQWAIDRGAGIGAEMVEAIRATGVEVVGDLRVLADPSVAVGVGENPSEVRVPTEVVARFTAGLVKLVAETPDSPPAESRTVGEIEALVRRERRGRRAERNLDCNEVLIQQARQQLSRMHDVDELTAAQILRVVAGRVGCRVRRMLGR
jgi:hypothetical protein